MPWKAGKEKLKDSTFFTVEQGPFECLFLHCSEVRMKMIHAGCEGSE